MGRSSGADSQQAGKSRGSKGKVTSYMPLPSILCTIGLDTSCSWKNLFCEMKDSEILLREINKVAEFSFRGVR